MGGTHRAATGSALFAGIPADARFYFVHSYAASTTIRRRAREPRLTTASISSPPVERGRLAATQFHPEKSGDVGAALLETGFGTL